MSGIEYCFQVDGKHSGRVEIADMSGVSPGIEHAIAKMPRCDTKAGSGGSPFGLARLEERIHAAGGRVMLASAPGQGCQVSVELPLLPRIDLRAAGLAASEPA